MKTLPFLFTLVSGCFLGGGQPAICEHYLECYDAVASEREADSDGDTDDIGARDYLEGLYGPGGSCWDGPLMRASCKTGCEVALDILRDGDEPAACK